MSNFSFPVRWLAVSALVAGAAGCAANGGVGGLFDAAPGARFSGASEQGFLALVEHQCAALTVGDQPLGQLLKGDQPFQTLTVDLFRGEMSNDAYVARVLARYPAADGNVPATGCVVQQFNACISGRCKVSKATAVETPQPAPASAPVAAGPESS